jgi:glycosyltransferase involved in cell wall biosynthesis
MFDGRINVARLGRFGGVAVQQEMNRAVALVVPSICYETFGLVIVEAFASGTLVLASRMGALAELVREGGNGFMFRARK